MDGRVTVTGRTSVNLRAAKEFAGALFLVGSGWHSVPVGYSQDERLWANSVSEAQQIAAQRRCWYCFISGITTARLVPVSNAMFSVRPMSRAHWRPITWLSA